MASVSRLAIWSPRGSGDDGLWVAWGWIIEFEMGRRDWKVHKETRKGLLKGRLSSEIVFIAPHSLRDVCSTFNSIEICAFTSSALISWAYFHTHAYIHINISAFRTRDFSNNSKHYVFLLFWTIKLKILYEKVGTIITILLLFKIKFK